MTRLSELPRKREGCTRCSKLEERLKMITVREMNLRVELDKVKRAGIVKQQYANRTRW